MENQGIPMYKERPSGYQVITGIFIFLILAVFPLFFTDYYYNILPTKYYFYMACVLTLMTAALVYGSSRLAAGGEEELKRRIFRCSAPDLFMAAFLLISVVSTLQSDYLYESFWGNEGRYNGLFLWLLYGAGYFIITRFFWPKRWYLDAFLAAGMLACLFGITHYFRMDLLGFKKNMLPEQLDMFASTIGNVNTYTAYVALVMGAAAVMYCTSGSRGRTLLYYVCMVVSFFAIIMGLSDNSYLALAALFAFLPLYLFRRRTGIRRYLLMLASFSGVIWVIDLINKHMADRVVKMDGMLQALSGFERLEYVVAGLFTLTALVYLAEYLQRSRKQEEDQEETEDRACAWLVYAWLGFLMAAAAIVFYALYDANVAGNGDRYGKLAGYLVFNDDWGTHRGFNWRICMENYMKFPLHHKIFGFGPDTYGIITHYNNYDEMVRMYNETYDSVHNEYLQYFITVGPIGAFAYTGLLISAVIRVFRKASANPCAVAALFAVICYAVQAVVNISLPISTPIMMTLLMMALAACERPGETGELPKTEER